MRLIGLASAAFCLFCCSVESASADDACKSFNFPGGMRSPKQIQLETSQLKSLIESGRVSSGPSLADPKFAHIGLGPNALLALRNGGNVTNDCTSVCDKNGQNCCMDCK